MGFNFGSDWCTGSVPKSLSRARKLDAQIPLSFSFATILPPEPKSFSFLEASRRAYNKNVCGSLAGIVYG
jgi:hypothetical protein